ncbi:MAG: glycoside hydrolase family 28 protein [Cyclobacteriaceae bacterium]|nr:glycoside hydrolase family 28 protein [Cyclobacteriaceae bacterium]
MISKNSNENRRFFLIKTGLLSLGVAGAAGMGFTKPPQTAADRSYNVLDFGAKGDGKTLNSIAIQKAIDRAADNNGGTVYFPAGKFITGTILLKDNVELHLDRGAVLLGSPFAKDYPRQPLPKYRSLRDDGGFYSLIYAEGANNIAITGKGTLDGQGANHTGLPNSPSGDMDGRPKNIILISCKKIEISGITLRNSAMWNQHYLNCEDLIIDNIQVYNHCNRNNDGIDIDGCRRVVLSNSIIDSDDDAICLKSTGTAPCENILINNCIVSSFCNGIKTGTESTGGFRNINISNCIVKPSIHPEAPKGNKFTIGITGLSLEIVDGGVMEGVSVNNLTIEGTMCPVYVRLGGRNRKHMEDAPEPAVGRMSNISIHNITAYQSGNFTCSVTGIPGHNVENIKLSNFNIVHQGDLIEGGYLKSFDEVNEDIKGYPQPTRWGNLPVSGLFVRHVKGITVNNFSIDANAPDPRPIFMLHDVKNIKVRDIYVGENCNQEETYLLKEVTNHTLENNK